MRILTYNIWNTDSGMPKREQYIIEELKSISADVICLQEVIDCNQANRIANKLGYEYKLFDNYPDEEEGLCILCKTPIIESASWIKEHALFACIEYNGAKVGAINLHLPWESMIRKEECIAEILKNIKEYSVDYLFLVGDYNCSELSDIHRMLLGDCTINGVEANPYFYDLASAYAQISNTNLDSTLNFRENPRFIGNTIEVNQRFDRILMQNTYPKEFPILKECKVFGKKIYEDISLSASDHYGVYAEIIL